MGNEDCYEREARKLLAAHPTDMDVRNVAAALRERDAHVEALQEELRDGETDKQAAEEMLRLAGKYMDERDDARAQLREIEARLIDAPRHLECSAYERADVQDYLRYLRGGGI